MIINNKSVRGIFLYSDDVEFENGDFVVEDNSIFICTANDPTNTTLMTVSGQRPSMHPENYNSYPGNKITSSSEYYDYINGIKEWKTSDTLEGVKSALSLDTIVVSGVVSDSTLLPEAGTQESGTVYKVGTEESGYTYKYILWSEDKYISSHTLSEILQNSYFGIGEDGIVSDYAIWTADSGLSYSISGITDASEEGVLEEIMRTPGLNNGIITISRSLPELRTLAVSGSSMTDTVILKQHTYIDNGSGSGKRVRIQEIIDPVDGKEYYRWMESSYENNAWVWTGGISVWKSSHEDSSSVIDEVNAIRDYYEKKCKALELKESQLTSSFCNREVSNPTNPITLKCGLNVKMNKSWNLTRTGYESLLNSLGITNIEEYFTLAASNYTNLVNTVSSDLPVNAIVRIGTDDNYTMAYTLASASVPTWIQISSLSDLPLSFPEFFSLVSESEFSVLNSNLPVKVIVRVGDSSSNYVYKTNNTTRDTTYSWTTTNRSIDKFVLKNYSGQSISGSTFDDFFNTYTITDTMLLNMAAGGNHTTTTESVTIDNVTYNLPFIVNIVDASGETVCYSEYVLGSTGWGWQKTMNKPFYENADLILSEDLNDVLTNKLIDSGSSNIYVFDSAEISFNIGRTIGDKLIIPIVYSDSTYCCFAYIGRVWYFIYENDDANFQEALKGLGFDISISYSSYITASTFSDTSFTGQIPNPKSEENHTTIIDQYYNLFIKFTVDELSTPFYLKFNTAKIDVSGSWEYYGTEIKYKDITERDSIKPEVANITIDPLNSDTYEFSNQMVRVGGSFYHNLSTPDWEEVENTADNEIPASFAAYCLVVRNMAELKSIGTMFPAMNTTKFIVRCDSSYYRLNISAGSKMVIEGPISITPSNYKDFLITITNAENKGVTSTKTYIPFVLYRVGDSYSYFYEYAGEKGTSVNKWNDGITVSTPLEEVKTAEGKTDTIDLLSEIAKNDLSGISYDSPVRLICKVDDSGIDKYAFSGKYWKSITSVPTSGTNLGTLSSTSELPDPFSLETSSYYTINSVYYVVTNPNSWVICTSLDEMKVMLGVSGDLEEAFSVVQSESILYGTISSDTEINVICKVGTSTDYKIAYTTDNDTFSSTSKLATITCMVQNGSYYRSYNITIDLKDIRDYYISDGIILSCTDPSSDGKQRKLELNTGEIKSIYYRYKL